MPKVGDKDFPYTDEGIKQAAAESAVSGIPVSNAGERNVTTYAGGGKTGYNIPRYKEGGKTIKHVYPDGTWYEGPDTPEARKRIKDEEFYQKNVKPGEDKIKAEEDKKKKDKAKAEADAKKAENDKKRAKDRELAAKVGTSPAPQGGGGRYEKGGKVTEGAGKHLDKAPSKIFTEEQMEEIEKMFNKRKTYRPKKRGGIKRGLQEEFKKKIIMKPPAKKAK